MTFEPRLLATGIGSVPLRDPREAVKFIRKHFPVAPHWPQLPSNSFEESFLGQFLAPLFHFGIATRDGSKVYFNWKAEDFENRLTEFYTVALEALEGSSEALEYFAFPKDYASGFYAFLESLNRDPGEARFVKGQLSGPLTVGLQLVDQDRRAVYYNPQLKDVLIKTLTLHGLWQAKALGQTGLPVILFVDDPSLSSYGLSSYITLNKEAIRGELNEIYAGPRQTGALLGTHVCASTDWTILMDSTVDIINFDAYEFFDSLAVYPEKLRNFLARGGSVAWGLVPTSEKVLGESANSLAGRFEGYLANLEAKGIARDAMIRSSLLTPSCGTGTLSREITERVYALTAELGISLGKLS